MVWVAFIVLQREKVAAVKYVFNCSNLDTLRPRQDGRILQKICSKSLFIWKVLYFGSSVTEISSHGTQAVIRTNVGLVYWHLYTSLGLNLLNMPAVLHKDYNNFHINLVYFNPPAAVLQQASRRLSNNGARY